VIDLLTEQECEWPEYLPSLKETPQEPVQLPDAEVSQLIANGTLTEEAWQAHLQGGSWQIQVQQ